MDCIYEGARSMYINPDECVDCGACKSICRMDAIYTQQICRQVSTSTSPTTPPSSARPCRAAMDSSAHPVALPTSGRWESTRR